MEIVDIENISLKDLLSDKDVFYAVFNALNISWFAVNKEGKVLVWNDNLKELVKKLFPNKDLDNIRVSEIDELAWENLVSIMQNSNTETIEEQAPNGHWYLSVKSPLIINGVVEGVAGIAIDITKQKQAEIAKAEFLANMSHDLKIPFSGIYSMADYLYQHETDPTKKEFLSDIVQSSKGFLSLLSQILELSHLNDEPLTSTHFNLQAEVNEVSTMFQAELKVKGLSLDIDCPNAIINSDKFKLSKILLNLLGNAIKFTENGHIQIHVNFNPTLNITVKDTGIGISEEHQNHIFDKFYKIVPSYKTGIFKGTGLGLYIVQKTVKELGGFVTVESKLGDGSCFTVSLPVKNAA
jgi:two-component system aerobic respiration control sensor histidine kinase ArcB